MKHLFIIILSLVVISSCTNLSPRQPTSAAKKHYIITMHGVRGNAESYGEFHTFVDKVLTQVDPTYKYELFNWTYPVGAAVDSEVDLYENTTPMRRGAPYKKKIDDVWNPHLIGMKFNRDFFLGTKGQKPLIPQLGPEDKISVIAYSMGGMMAMTWYYDTMFNHKFRTNFSYSEAEHARLQNYLSRVENIIGLGPVYWGSIDAELGWSFLENGSLKEIQKAIPQVKQLCDSNEVKQILADAVNYQDENKKLSEKEKYDKFIITSLKKSCGNLETVGKIVGFTEKLPSLLLKGTSAAMKAGGNMHPQEMNHMRLTSDVINEMRLNRISHLAVPEYSSRYRAKWTNIVGVFPCLRKADKGLTCNLFESLNYQLLNDQLVTIFSGHTRRETDGPVFAPGATSEFIYYIENPGKIGPIEFHKFTNTADLQKRIHVPSRDIFVENMHATVIPAIDGLTGLLESTGDKSAKAMSDFDKALGADVVIMNKECAIPGTCKHPNFKHVIEVLGNCEAGKIGCNQSLVNEYFNVDEESERYLENEKLFKELGTYAVIMNIRLPKNYKEDLSTPEKILSKINFHYTSDKSLAKRKDLMNLEARLVNRLDSTSDLYANQINRPQEIMASYAIVKDFKNSKVVRLYFMGRAWPKNPDNKAARDLLADGVPVKMDVKFPGLIHRQVTAKVRPTYSTYVDFYLSEK